MTAYYPHMIHIVFTYTLPCCRLTTSPTLTIVCTHKFSGQRKLIPMHIFHHVHGKARTCTRAQNRAIFFCRSSFSIRTKPLGDYDSHYIYCLKPIHCYTRHQQDLEGVLCSAVCSQCRWSGSVSVNRFD